MFRKKRKEKRRNERRKSDGEKKIHPILERHVAVYVWGGKKGLVVKREKTAKASCGEKGGSNAHAQQEGSGKRNLKKCCSFHGKKQQMNDRPQSTKKENSRKKKGKPHSLIEKSCSLAALVERIPNLGKEVNVLYRGGGTVCGWKNTPALEPLCSGRRARVVRPADKSGGGF